MLKRGFIITAILLLGVITLVAQNRGIFVKGKVIDASNNQPLEYATVSLFTEEDKLITGAITKEDGSFELKSNNNEFYVKVNFLGYKTSFVRDIHINKGIADLKVIKVSPDQNLLNEVTIVAEKSQTVFKLDKRVFNVGKDLSSAGGSALDVLNNVPSVDVNIEGTVSLRGNSNVQILINGKPSVLTSNSSNALGTITSDMIERVEVITNPSAKYDAEGTTGILNIILKKNERKGLNGSVTLNTGYPNNHSVGLSLNRRTEKFNLFSQLGVGKRTFLRKSEGYQLNNGTLIYDYKGDSEKNEMFYNILLGADYHINKYNVLTLSGHYAYEFEDEPNSIEYMFPTATDFTRKEESEATNPKWEYDLQYKKSFKRNKDQSLLVSAKGSFFGKDKNSVYTNDPVTNNSFDAQQKLDNDFRSAIFTFAADYLHPFSEGNELEVGTKYNIEDLKEDYQVFDFVNSDYVHNDNLSNIFNLNQKIFSVYATYGLEIGRWGIKGGARFENTNMQTELENDNTESSRNYSDLFPSIHSSFKLNEKLSVQLGYSKRIHRPRMWSLNPFVSLTDLYSKRTGNPNLRPEYTDSYELNLIQNMNKGSVNMAVFYRNTTSVITRIFDKQNNETISYPINLGSTQSYGVELNGKLDVVKWLTVLGDMNWNYYNRQGNYRNQVYDFNSSSWSARVTGKYKITKGLDAETKVKYTSDYKDIQSTYKGSVVVDLGIKKKILKGRGVINFSVRDLLATGKYESYTDGGSFYKYQKSFRGRQMVIGFSYSFGKGEAMQYSGFKMF
ncbi:MAG: TonB-dependent receptor domain-containing protein [Hyphomicrobiales bacterium]